MMGHARCFGLLLGFGAVVALMACGGTDENGTTSGSSSGSSSGSMALGTTGAVYAMTNAKTTNEIVVYERAADGKLTKSSTVATTGGGSGVQLDGTDSLGSQGGLMLNGDHSLLFAVNTETASDDNDCTPGSISVFTVGEKGALTLAGTKVPSGGLFPSSLTIRDDVLYVLNSGGPDQCMPAAGFEPNPNITGFKIGADGSLTPIAGAVQTINPGMGPAPDDCAPGGFPNAQFDCGLNPPAFPRSPGQVAFTPGGNQLVVTVKGTNSIHVFPLDAMHVAGKATVYHAPAMTLPTYFGFSFDVKGHLVVSEPFGTAATIPMGNASAVSTFKIDASGSLMPLSTAVANGQTASCWIAINPLSGKHAYSSNNGTSNVSIFDIDDAGMLKHRDGEEVALPGVGMAMAHPNDMAVVMGKDDTGADVSYLYTLNAGTGQVGMFVVHADGSLKALGEVEGLAEEAGAQGLAAY